MTPVAGSAVSTRRMRSAASGVPSATTTCPAWIDLPMPTPPPWWIDTHEAPQAVLTSALSSGQSATASEPSRIASVSRCGDATDPASRWSRPMTIGALHGAARDELVERQAGEVALAVPSQQMRAGSPWKAMRSRASPIQRAILLLLAEEIEDHVVGRGDVGRVAGQRHPAERPLALAEQRADVRRDEAGVGERVARRRASAARPRSALP